MKSPRSRPTSPRCSRGVRERWLVAPGRREHHAEGWSIPNYPSPLAIERWYHVERVGHARCPVGHHLKHGEQSVYLLHFVHAGEIEYVIRDRRHPVRAGDMCLLDLAEPAEHRNLGPRLAGLYWVTFRGPDLEWWFEHLHAEAEPVFWGVDSPYVTHLFCELIRLTEQRPPGFEPRTAMLLGSLLAELHAVRERANPLFTKDRLHVSLSAPIRAALQHMFVMYHSPLSISKVSRFSGLSPDRFGHRFREEVGLPPMTWLAHFRVERARELLDHSRRQIREIGRLVGIPDPAHFSHLFRQIAGMSPREYRHRPPPSRSSSAVSGEG
ncbi:MAG: helix-turn-helix domain-containing protein [Terrimicrobiaceae bacterium]